jgi:hypothetical protein
LTYYYFGEKKQRQELGDFFPYKSIPTLHGVKGNRDEAINLSKITTQQNVGLTTQKCVHQSDNSFAQVHSNDHSEKGDSVVSVVSQRKVDFLM